jgi:hypothetical protein
MEIMVGRSPDFFSPGLYPDSPDSYQDRDPGDKKKPCTFVQG